MAEVSRQLIDDLREFRTRPRAMSALVWAGAEAVPLLIEALADRVESVRWAAGKCLADIGDARAVEPLVARLDNARDRSWAAGFLERLTGDDLPNDPDGLAEWVRRRSAPAAPLAAKAETAGKARKAAVAAAGAADDEALVRQAVAGLKARMQAGKNACTLDVPLAEGRHQTVIVVTAHKDADGAALVIVYSACAPALPKHFEWALRTNMTLPYGAIAIRDVRGQPTFVMFNTLLRAACTPLELRKSILTIAERADTIEKMLTGEDKR